MQAPMRGPTFLRLCSVSIQALLRLCGLYQDAIKGAKKAHNFTTQAGAHEEHYVRVPYFRQNTHLCV